jgi:hypothetical protein
MTKSGIVPLRVRGIKGDQISDIIRPPRIMMMANVLEYLLSACTAINQTDR